MSRNPCKPLQRCRNTNSFKQFKLINLPFYYVGQLDRVLEHIEMIPVE